MPLLLLLAFSFTSCEEYEMESQILGTWKLTDVEGSAYENTYTITFKEDGSYSVESDSDELSAVMDVMEWDTDLFGYTETQTGFYDVYSPAGLGMRSGYKGSQLLSVSSIDESSMVFWSYGDSDFDSYNYKLTFEKLAQ